MAKDSTIRLRVGESTVGILEQVGGNRSEYLRRLVEQHHHDWQEALHHLRAVGVTVEQLRATIDVANGLLVGPFPLSSALSLSLDEAEHHDGTATRWGAADGWPAFVATVGRDEALARSLWLVAREYWLGHEGVARAVDRG